jgi:hypothetical protein
MDPELLALLERLHDEANPLTDEELHALQAAIAERVATVDRADPSADDIAVLTEARDRNREIEAQLQAHADERAERVAQAAELLAELPAEAPAETVAEGDPTAAETATEPEPTTGEAEETVEPEPVPVAASGGAPEPVLPRISRLASRTPRAHRPTATATDAVTRVRPSLVASADLPGIVPGEPLDIEKFAHSAKKRIDAVMKVSSDAGNGEFIPLGMIDSKPMYPADRWLDQDAANNDRKVRAVLEPAAMAAAAAEAGLTASGGICGPVGVDYNVAGISVADRPVKGAMAQFGATRGGLRYILPHTLAQVTADGPAALWTAANDANPVSPALKPHATFLCQNVQESTVDAVTSIAQFGNFQSRYFPEQIAQYLEEVDAVHARLAEATLQAAMITGSTTAFGETILLGAARDVLAIVDRAAAAMRYRHRMDPDAPLRFVYPDWLDYVIRVDLARQLPGDSGSGAERLAVTDAQIDNFFAVRQINTTRTMDAPTGQSGQGFGVQGAGLLLPWSQDVITWLYPEGSWMFLDGGELNLGMIRDSTLNATNNFQMFSETFEKAIFRGHESISLQFDICPNGQTASTVDTSSLCLSGS